MTRSLTKSRGGSTEDLFISGIPMTSKSDLALPIGIKAQSPKDSGPVIKLLVEVGLMQSSSYDLSTHISCSASVNLTKIRQMKYWVKKSRKCWAKRPDRRLRRRGRRKTRQVDLCRAGARDCRPC